MSNPIHTLIKIQEIDLAILEIEREDKGYNDGIKNATEEAERLSAQLEVLEGDYNSVDESIKEVKEIIRVNNEKLSKDEERTSDVTTDKQLKALNKEMVTARKNIKMANERLEKLDVTYEERKARYDAKSEELMTKQEELERLTGELETKTPEWESVLSVKQGERETATGEITPAILKRYENIKAKRAGIGLVEILDETCLGCNIHVPPQLYIKVLRGDEELMTCPNCHRLLYCVPKEAS